MHIDPAFRLKIDYLDLESIQTSGDTIFIVDHELQLRAYNDAWSQFAIDNGGAAILDTFGFGNSISGAFPERLKGYFVGAYKAALMDNQRFDHDYECPSPRQFRKFRQSAYPLLDAAGLVISNHLIEAQDHSGPGLAFSRDLIDQRGIVTQCCNCRKIRKPDNPNVWVWVPDAVHTNYPNTSHGICPRCLDHYYPDIDDE